MKKFAAFAFAIAAGILMVAGPSANAAPAAMCVTLGLKAATGTTVELRSLSQALALSSRTLPLVDELLVKETAKIVGEWRPENSNAGCQRCSVGHPTPRKISSANDTREGIRTSILCFNSIFNSFYFPRRQSALADSRRALFCSVAISSRPSFFFFGIPAKHPARRSPARRRRLSPKGLHPPAALQQRRAAGLPDPRNGAHAQVVSNDDAVVAQLPAQQIIHDLARGTPACPGRRR